MPTISCDECDQTFDGDAEQLVAEVKSHYDTAHRGPAITEMQIRNYVAACLRAHGPTERLESVGEVRVERTSAVDPDAILRFFDRDAFADNPAWASCYCMFHHVLHEGEEQWGERSWEQNRSDLAARLRSGATTGFVAAVDGAIAGWMNASPRPAFPFHDTDGDQHVIAIVCFAIAPPYRGHGVARALLDAAIEHSTETGAIALEAYPPKSAPDGASAYPGTVEMYEAAGFETVGETERGFVMQRRLG